MPRKFDILVRRKDPIFSQQGVGTEIKKILKERFKAEPGGGCPCNGRMAEMNANGIQWCKDNKPTIHTWLMEGAKTWKAGKKGAAKTWVKLIPQMAESWYISSLIDEAIRNSEAAPAKIVQDQPPLTQVAAT